jgi:hypothetical protein
MSKPGSCHLCGADGVQLTKDHIQPQCGFNEKNRKYVRLEWELDITRQQKSAPHGKKFRSIYYEIQPDNPIAGGIYRYTQCSPCNKLLGECYDPHFGRFCHDAVANMKLGSIVVVQTQYRQTIKYPLAILKRIIAMFFSINGEKFVHANPELSRFVLEPENRELPSMYRVFVGYNSNDMVSHIPFQIRTTWPMTRKYGMTQIAHPPFVYLLTFDTARPDNRLVEFTGFTQYTYDDEANVVCDFRPMPTNNCFAGDFRRKGKIIPDEQAVFSSGLPATYYKLVDLVV